MALFDGVIERVREFLANIVEAIPDRIWDTLANVTSDESIAAALFDWVNQQPVSAAAKERLSLLLSVTPAVANVTTPAAAADFLAQVQAGAARRGISATAGSAVQRKAFAEIARLKAALAAGKVRGFGGSKALTIATLILGGMFMLWNVPEAIFGWGTRSLNNLLDLFGVDKKYRIPQPPGDFTPPGFGQAAFTSLVKDMETRGLSTIRHPVTGDQLPFTAENLGEAMTALAVQRAVDGLSVFPNDLIKAIAPFLSFRAEAPGLVAAPAAPTVGEVTPPAPRVTVRSQKKPKLFVGTIFGGRLSVPEQFKRTPDDQINNDEELISDAEENLTRWLKSLPNKLTYELQIKNNPFDENNVIRPGTWVALALYITTRFGKRTFTDEILLGPVDPISYLPELGQDITISADLRDFGTGIDLGLPEVAALLGAPPAFVPQPAMPGAAAPALPSVPAAPAPAPVVPPAAPPVAPRGLPGIVTEEVIQLANRIAVLMPRRSLDQIAAEVGLTEAEVSLLERERLAGRLTLGAPLAQLAAAPAPAAPQVNQIAPRVVSVNVDALFVRSGPATSFPLAGSQRLVRGNVFTGVGWVQGENVAGENRWWLSSFGNYVWVGGTSEKPGMTEAIGGAAPFA